MDPNTNTAGEGELHQVEELWFSSDTVIIRAQDRIFRVFAAILKQKSSVFADMFAFPQPASSDVETMDGVPVVTVHDDPAEMEVFLKAIFDSDFFMPPPATATIHNCLGILRLAHKYDVPYLRRRSLEHLHSMFPSCPSDLIRDPRRSSQKTSQKFDEIVATIATGTEVGALWLLPVVYYLVLSKWNLSGVIRQPQWLALGAEQQMAGIGGYPGLANQAHKIFSFFFIARNEDDEGCLDWAECNRKRILASSRILSFISEVSPASAMRYSMEGHWEGLGLCEHCLPEAQEMHRAATQTCWDVLPTIFGFPEWEQLEQMRNAALAP
ncbi:BTB domain-containing protein [Favolaschia claudopus]|uniref:BTB domain-containing protein n=1 Tax=Favolaschia claudopus TaxID=2862362 RepID=A0AAW0BEN6_9AGAR